MRALLLLLCCLFAWPAAGDGLQVTVADPFLEMRSGPGRGYPVFHVVPRGEQVTILKRRTDWFKVRDVREREGWVDRRQMVRTLDDGEPLALDDPSREQFGEHRRELGVLAGDYGGANVIHAYFAYSVNPHLAIELGASQLLGNASNGELALLGVTHVFRPDWRLQPFVSLGTGLLHVSPKSTLVAPVDRTDQVAYVGAGAKYYLSRRFMLRADYKSYVVFTDRDDNQETNEWKVGFGFFF